MILKWHERLNSFPGVSIMMLIFLLIGNITVTFMENTWQWHFGVSLYVFGIWVGVVAMMLLSYYKNVIPIYRRFGFFQIPFTTFLVLGIVEASFFACTDLIAQNIWSYYPLLLMATAGMIIITMIFFAVTAFFVIVFSPKE